MARLFTPSESKYYLMALDAGTGSIRAVIFDLEGNQIAVGQAEWRHLAVPDVPGSMEFDLNKNWQLACECMRQALHNAGIAPVSYTHLLNKTQAASCTQWSVTNGGTDE